MAKKSKWFDLKAWHWISSAVCLIGMLLFALTGITLNHAGSIEGKAQVIAQEHQLPDAIISALNESSGSEHLPTSFLKWYESHTDGSIASLKQVQWSDFELYVLMPRAGGDTWFSVTLDTGEFYQEATHRGAIAYFNDLHKGRNTGFWWKMFLDLFSVACIVFTVTGLLLLKRYAKGRKSTWPLVLAGFAIPALVLVLPAHAANKNELEVEIPRINVAEYHPPYVAVWVSNSKRKAVLNLALWYDVKLADNEGEKWLKDLRMWWRRSGRALSFPIDGVTGATRRPGTAMIDLTPWQQELSALPAGDYTINIEAARELGGRELISLPITLPVSEPLQTQKSGQSELGTITLNMEPTQ